MAKTNGKQKRSDDEATFQDAYGDEKLPGGGRRFATVSVFSRTVEGKDAKGRKTTSSKAVLLLTDVDGGEEVLEDLEGYPAWSHVFRSLYLTNYDPNAKPAPPPACASVDGVNGTPSAGAVANLKAMPGYTAKCDGCPFARKGAPKECRLAKKLYLIRADSTPANASAVGQEIQINVPFVATIRSLDPLLAEGDPRKRRIAVVPTVAPRKDGSGTFNSIEFNAVGNTPGSMVKSIVALKEKAMAEKQWLLPSGAAPAALPAGEEADDRFA